MTYRLLWLVAVTIGMPAIARAQVSNEGLTQECPQGCRAIDQETSCGSVNDTAACSMSVNGDVLITCTNGNYFRLTTQGCYGNTFESIPYMWKRVILMGDRLAQLWEDHIRRFGKYIAIVEFSIGLYLIIGIFLPRITLVLLGLPIGLLTGFALAYLCNVYSTDLQLIAVTVAGGVATTLCCAKGMEAGAPVLGFGLGLVVECVSMAFALLYNGEQLRNLWWGIAPVFVASGVGWGLSAMWSPYFYFGGTCAVFSGILVGTSVSQWRDDRTIFECVAQKAFKLVCSAFAIAFVLALAANAFARRRRNAKKRNNQQFFTRVSGTDQELLNPK